MRKNFRIPLDGAQIVSHGVGMNSTDNKTTMSKTTFHPHYDTVEGIYVIVERTERDGKTVQTCAGYRSNYTEAKERADKMQASHDAKQPAS